MNSPVFLGLDGGGTRTRAFVMDAAGERTAWGESGLSNPNHATEEQLRANLAQAMGEAFAKLRSQAAHCVSAFLGMAGVTTAEGRTRLEQMLAGAGLKQARLGVDHDIRIALAGGLALCPGIALIVGTGSSCYGRTADGRTWQTGGWEALISDEGSAYFLGREAIAAAARMADGRSVETRLRQTVFEWLGLTEIAQLPPRIHDQGLSRSEIAAFAPQVVRLAEEQDTAARDILDRGAFLLAEMVSGNHRKLRTGPGPDIVITGGLGTALTIYREKIRNAIHEQLPASSVYQPFLAPAQGAALLALQQLGHQVTAELVQTMQRSGP
jgi:glucosamine kinase